MFDLEKEIKKWRSNFVSKGKLTPEIIDELESHLRESYHKLSSALPQKDAFHKALNQLGNEDSLITEFKKDNDFIFWDSLAIRSNSTILILVGLLVVWIGFDIGVNNGGLLALHVSSITLGYTTSFLLGLIGTYAIFRSIICPTKKIQFSHRYSNHCRILLLIISLGNILGLGLGMIWAHYEWGVFWQWDPREIGGLGVTVLALGSYVIIQKRNLSNLHLGQISLILSLSTFIAWFGVNGAFLSNNLVVLFLFYGAIIFQFCVFMTPFCFPRLKFVETDERKV